MEHFVYILKSLKDNRYYVGYTTDIKTRLKAHNDGLTKSTKGRRPLKMIYHETYEDKISALAREVFLKSSKGYKTKMALIKQYDKDHSFKF